MKNIYKSIFRVSTRIKEGIKPKISQIQANSQQNSKDPRKHAKLEIPKYIFEIDQIQEKIRRAKMVLYKDLAKKFEGKPLPKKHIVTPKIPQINKPQLTQTQIQADQPYKFNKKKYTDVPKINQLMNAAVSIQFHPQSIKYENQESVQTLIQNVFSQETEKNLRKKEKSMRKTLLDGCKLQNDLIQNLLMLYGLRREQQFLQNLVDPLQKILSSNKNNERRMLKFLADVINRMNTRKDYYEQIIIYLPFQELIKFSKIVSLIKKIDIVSWIIKYQNLMDISKFVLQNKELQKAFDNIHTMTESKLAENQVSLKHTFEIQLWILKILQNFKQSFQAEQFTKQSIIAVCQNLTIYYNLKKKLQNIVKQRNLNTLFSQHNQHIFSNVNKQELLKSQQLLQQKQQEQFYQKVSQIILFSDIYKENKNQQLEIYSSVFPILLEFQDIKIADHTFQKVIDDHMKVFKKLHSFETVTQNYIQLFAQFILRNLEVSISNEYALAIIKILWLHNIEKYRNKQQMTFDQGKYFVMSIHIISSYIKNIGKVDKDVIEYEVLTKNLRKYASMIQKNREQFNRLNKKNVLNLLEKGMGQLSKTGRQKNTVANLLQQIKTIAYNDKS